MNDLEIQNYPGVPNTSVLVDSVVCRRLATLQLFAKTNAAAGTLGTNLYASSAFQVAYAAGRTLELHADATNAYIRYNGTNYPTKAHGLDLAAWPDNAVCLVQAERLEAGNAVYADLDDLCVQRSSVGSDTNYLENFSTYPSETELGAMPQKASYPPDQWSTNLHAHTYVGQSNLVWLPGSWPNGWTWYNPRRTYQQDTRFLLTATNVVEMQLACNGFSNGIMKLAFTPEYLPQDAYWNYNGPLIYVEIKYASSNDLVFDLVRQWGVGDANRQWVKAFHTNAYDASRPITFQLGSSTAMVYYGSTCIIETSHGANALTVYPNGAYPHYEYQNSAATANALSILDSVRVRRLGGFQTP